MSRRRPRPRPVVALLPLALLVAASGVPAQAVAPRAVDGPGAARVAVGGGRAVTLPQVPGLRIENVVGSAGGWMAAGTVAEAAGPRMVLFRGDAGAARALPAPPRSGSALLQEPLPLVGEGGLRGVAWLEGEARGALAVRFAPWNGTGWEPAATVAPPAPGSQLALAGAVLDDGSLLLVWSAHDGGDDEVVWSRSTAAGWTAPRRLAADNRVPDITPSLAAVPGGAVAAWSRLEGSEYRVVAATFREGRWSEPRAIGPRGSLYPTFEAAGAAPQVLFRTAAPRGWTVVELDAEGRAWRAARTAVAAPQRPLLEEAGGAVALSWPGGEAAPAITPWESLP